MSATPAGVPNVAAKRNDAKRGNDDNGADALLKKKKQRKGSENGALKPTSAMSDEHGDAVDANDYPYHVVPDDHCETPMEAYQDISSFLDAIAGQLGKTREDLRIFDPYYCEGNMKERLNLLGFKNVRNEKQDFYELIRNDAVPEFDVLVTNPPYSGDHMEKLLRFCTGEQCRRPWFLLMPNYVYTKDYYDGIVGIGGASTAKGGSGGAGGVQKALSLKHASPIGLTSAGAVVQQAQPRPPFYVTPGGNRRYLYTTPKGRRQEKSAKYTSPFPTFWYCQVYE